MRFVVATLLFASAVGTLQAQPNVRKEPLADLVRVRIDKGISFLRNTQRPNGSWEVNLPSAGIEGGWTSLALLSLLNSGVPANDPTIRRGLEYLRKIEPAMVYVSALQAMVFAEAGFQEDLPRIRKNIKYLLDVRVLKDGKLDGWSYQESKTKYTDNSNTQYALLGLWAGKQAGIEIKEEIWESVRDYYLRTQEADGGWVYASTLQGASSNTTSATMTTAGLSGLLIAGMELNSGREVLQPGGAKNCGDYKEQGGIAKALSWTGRNFRLDLPQRTFYHLYGLERAGRLSGLRFFGDHDWYREGSEFLVKNQLDDGSFKSVGVWDQWPVVSTSFALLFLSKGRTPVLMSKLVHGAYPRRMDDEDWNNDRNDLRNLVSFASNDLFRKMPLAWQTFDIMRAVAPRGAQGPTDADMDEVVSDLLQSPILYINGHKSPRLRFTKTEKDLLKRYVESGGFIFAEACCSSPEFDRGFHDLCAEIWPDNDLSWLPAEHSIWQFPHVVTPGQSFKLKGISMGCKLILVYSPQDLSCRWESNAHQKDGEVLQSFRLGCNVVAYATGMEPPRPRLTKMQVAGTKDDPPRIPRGYLKVAQLKHKGDWQPAPRAMRNVMEHVAQNYGVDVALKTETRELFSENIVDFKFVYMQGRNEFAFDAEELQSLRFNLTNGGLLFADASCGREGFDKGFRKLAEALFPGKKLEPVPADDLLYSKELTGEAITEQTIRLRRDPGGPMRNQPPALEGVKIDGRWVLLYSKYDIGCALERHQSPDCRGYEPDSALKLVRAAVMYVLRP